MRFATVTTALAAQQIDHHLAVDVALAAPLADVDAVRAEPRMALAGVVEARFWGGFGFFHDGGLMQSEKTFEQAVQLAGTFVANGDIRMGRDVREGSVAMEQLADLIPSLYQMLIEARENTVGRTA